MTLLKNLKVKNEPEIYQINENTATSCNQFGSGIIPVHDDFNSMSQKFIHNYMYKLCINNDQLFLQLFNSDQLLVSNKVFKSE